MSFSEILSTENQMDIEQKIVEELLNNNNLESKTELHKPMAWSCLNVVEEFLKEKKLPKSIDVLRKFTQITFKYMISYDRKGRLEYIDALNRMRESRTEEIDSTSAIAMGGMKK